jgi:hypothetical protein
MDVRPAKAGEGPIIAALNGLVHHLHVAQRPDILRKTPDLGELARTL